MKASIHKTPRRETDQNTKEFSPDLKGNGAHSGKTYEEVNVQ